MSKKKDSHNHEMIYCYVYSMCINRYVLFILYPERVFVKYQNIEKIVAKNG